MAFSRVILARYIRRPLAILTLRILSSESIRLPTPSKRCRERPYALLLYTFARWFSHATATRYCRSPFLIAVFACYLRTLARHLHSLHSFALLHMLFTRFFRSVFSHVVYTRTFPSPCLQVTLARYCIFARCCRSFFCLLFSHHVRLQVSFAIFASCSRSSYSYAIFAHYFRSLCSHVISSLYLRSQGSFAIFTKCVRSLHVHAVFAHDFSTLLSFVIFRDSLLWLASFAS